MSATTTELAHLLQRHGQFLTTADEALDARQFHLLYGVSTIPDRVDLPPALQTTETKVIECFNADWSSLEELDGPVVAYLNALCQFFTNIYAAHAAAVHVFRRASEAHQPYTLYLRSFSQVTREMFSGAQGRVVAWFNDERLDRNVAVALSGHREELHPVACAHTDDLSLTAGRWTLPAFRVHDHTWKPVVRAAIESSKLIVFYVGDAGEGIRFELDAIEEARLSSRTVLLTADARAANKKAYPGYAAVLPVTSAVVQEGNRRAYRLSDEILTPLRKLARDPHRPSPVDPSLTSLPCEVVDPNAPEELASRYDLDHSYFVTPTNITALYWYTSGFPASFEMWNRIARGLFREQRPPSRSDLDMMQRSLIQGSIGAAALGLTASLSCLVALRTVFAALVLEPNAARAVKRKKRFLELLDIADRFDALTVRHFWRPQIEKWREAIKEDAFH